MSTTPHCGFAWPFALANRGGECGRDSGEDNFFPGLWDSVEKVDSCLSAWDFIEHSTVTMTD